MLSTSYKETMERAHAICQMVLDLSDEYSTKGKTVLQIRIASDLSIRLEVVASNINILSAIVTGKAPIKADSRTYKALKQDAAFIKLAKRAMKKYNSIRRVSIENAKQRAYTICRMVIALSKEYQNKGKRALQGRIAKDLSVSLHTVDDYIQTIRDVAEDRSSVSRTHSHISKALKQDAAFIKLAKNVIAKYDSLDRTYPVRRVCQLVFDFSDEYKTKGKAELQLRILKELRAENMTLRHTTLGNYILLIRAIAGERGQPTYYRSFYDLLSKDKKFVRIAKRTIAKYDAICAVTKRRASMDALYEEVVGLAQSNAEEIITTMPRGIAVVHKVLEPEIAALSRRKQVSGDQLTEEVIVWTFAGYLYDHYKSDPKDRVADDPKAFLKAKKVPEFLYARILYLYAGAKDQKSV